MFISFKIFAVLPNAWLNIIICTSGISILIAYETVFEQYMEDY